MTMAHTWDWWFSGLRPSFSAPSPTPLCPCDFCGGGMAYFNKDPFYCQGGRTGLGVEIMRTLCDACESAAAVVFCAADEASLCRSCDHKVHMCNKLASRHVRVRLADPVDVPKCDICESSPAFFYCEIDGSSLCLQCDMAVHVGGKRTHRRYLLFKQRVEFPGDNAELEEDLTLQLMDQAENKSEHNQLPKQTLGENQQGSPAPVSNLNDHETSKRGTNMIDLNMKPNKMHDEASNHQEP